MKRKIILILLCTILAFSITACHSSQKEKSDRTPDPLNFLNVKIGDSKEKILDKFENATTLENGSVNCTNIKTDYGNENNSAFFSFNDSDIAYEIGINWRFDKENDAQKVYNSLKEKVEDSYGDSYDSMNDSDVSEQCIWETDDYDISLFLQLNDTLNGNLVEIQYADYDKLAE